MEVVRLSTIVDARLYERESLSLWESRALRPGEGLPTTKRNRSSPVYKKAPPGRYRVRPPRNARGGEVGNLIFSQQVKSRTTSMGWSRQPPRIQRGQHRAHQCQERGGLRSQEGSGGDPLTLRRESQAETCTGIQSLRQCVTSSYRITKGEWQLRAVGRLTVGVDVCRCSDRP